jgi:signal transduction histidine kinase
MITKTLVEQYGGEIWVDSEPGQGSKFSFKLKIIIDEAADSHRDIGIDLD